MASNNKTPRLAWIGLGNMGRGMIRNIIEKGSYKAPMLIHNRTVSKAHDYVSSLASGKAKVAETIQACVEGADMVFLCVGDDAAVEATIASALESSSAKDTLFVDCSTIHPDTTNRVAKRIEESGAHFVACPVFGAPAMAETGNLIAVLAGPSPQTSRVRPFCKGVMARAEVDFSDQPAGNATRLKIIGNTLILAMIEALSEGHVLAEKSGLGTDNFHAYVEQMFPGPYTAYSNRMRSGDYYQRDGGPAFTAELARTVFGHAMSLADESGVKMKSLEQAGKHLEQVVEYSGAKGDIAGVYGAVRRESGLEFENQGGSARRKSF